MGSWSSGSHPIILSSSARGTQTMSRRCHPAVSALVQPEVSWCPGPRSRAVVDGRRAASELRSYHLSPIQDDSTLILHPGDDPTLEPGESRRAPVGSVGAAVTPGRRRTADVPLGAVVVRRRRRVIQEGEPFVTGLVQPLAD